MLDTLARGKLVRLTALALVVMCSLSVLAWQRPHAAAQEPARSASETPPPMPAAGGEGPKAGEPAASGAPPVAKKAAPKPAASQSLSWVHLLLFEGGPLMVPIGAMSLLVVAVGIERALGLRRRKVFPKELVEGLGRLASTSGGFDPRRAYRLCQEYPSAAANVVRAMLLKVGRPHSEVEHAVAETSQREAARLYAPVRWLNLATAVTPLMGLLGTVQGMIIAFFQTTRLEAGQNKADFLAAGIYVALVTTLGGLLVAIPAAMLAHYFEGRIQTIFHQIDEMLFNLLPQVERYEGRVRFGRLSGDGEPVIDEAEGSEETPAAAK